MTDSERASIVHMEAFEEVATVGRADQVNYTFFLSNNWLLELSRDKAEWSYALIEIIEIGGYTNRLVDNGELFVTRMDALLDAAYAFAEIQRNDYWDDLRIEREIEWQEKEGRESRERVLRTFKQ